MKIKVERITPEEIVLESATHRAIILNAGDRKSISIYGGGFEKAQMYSTSPTIIRAALQAADWMRKNL
jgi:hypothetical protein